jgi:hypothetical protein
MINMSFLSCTKKAVISNEESEYTIAKRINTSETYEDFLDIFPNSKYKDEIISKVKEIKRKCSFAIEKNDYDIVCVDNNITCFKIYLLRYPEGLFKKDALSHIDSLCKKRLFVYKYYRF